MRLDGYVRVSQVRGRGGDTFISPAVQRQRIEAWAAAYGHEIIRVFEELDQSGARADRPMLAEALTRVENGVSDGIIVAKLDRFGRSLIDGLHHIERIQTAGGTFVSVADGFDLTTDTGRLVLRIMLSLAQFDLDRVRTNWDDAKAEAVARGIHVTANAPFGYTRPTVPGPNGGRKQIGPLLVHETNGPLVTELFRRRADEGTGYTELGRWLEAQGAVTVYGRTKWGLRAVKDIIKNDVYLGIASSGQHRKEDAHPALTDHDTFARAHRPGTQFAKRSDKPAPIVTPLMRCASCRYRMRSARRMWASGEVWYYSCRSQASRSWECEDSAHIATRGEIEAWVVDRYFEQATRIRARHHEADAARAELAETAKRQQATFVAWRDDARIQERLGMEAYLAGLAARQDQLNATLAQLAQHDVAEQSIPIEVDELRAIWPTLSLDEQRDLLRTTIAAVFVRPSSHGPTLDDRLHIVFADEPVELPRRGHRDFAAEPFVFPINDDLDT